MSFNKILFMRKAAIPVLVLIMLLTVITKSVKAQITLIPDPKFEQVLIDLGLDIAPVNGYVPKANISSIISLDVANRNITDLTGIQDFVSLTRLLCNTNNLTKLDITKNTALTGLICDRNQLAALDVTKNTALTSLSCTNNRIVSLDITKNTLLRNIACDDNQLQQLDVTKNTALISFGCGSNLLTTLDMTKNTAVTSFGCDDNQLTTLDVTKITGLTSFGCSNNRLTNLDVTRNSFLYSFECFNNLFTTLDVTKNSRLTTLNCAGNQLSYLDLTKNPALIYLRCMNNKLTFLDLSQKVALTEIRCNNNQLTCLTLKNGFNSNITIMNATNNNSLTCIQVDDEILSMGYSGWSKDLTAQYKNSCSPAIISFSPATACNGDVITITGCNLNEAASVNFGGVPAAAFTILSASVITAIVSNGASGSIDVITPGGKATLPGFILNKLSVPASLSISPSANNICPSATVTFTAITANTGAAPTYQWKLNGSVTGGNNLTYSNNNFINGDKVYCILNSVKTCPGIELVYSDTVTMIVKPVPQIIFNPSNPSIAAGSSVQLNANITGGISSYLWTPSTGLNNTSLLNPVASPVTTTAYNLTVTGSNNCTAGKNLTVTVLKGIYFPNSFTPNGDNKNDIFRITPGTFFNLKIFAVYDRYGNTIFKTSDINKGWDGTYKGFKSPQGSYTYLIKGTDLKGDFFLNGSVLLIR